MHLEFLREAVRLAVEKMRAGGGGPFGAVVVKDGRIIGRGWNQVTSTNDPTAHAEVGAIRDACRALGTFRLAGGTLYASCEPCPMCLAAIYWARLDKVFFASASSAAADAGFDDARIYRELALPAAQRRLPMEHIPLAEAAQAFAEWRAKPDKIEY